MSPNFRASKAEMMRAAGGAADVPHRDAICSRWRRPTGKGRSPGTANRHQPALLWRDLGRTAEPARCSADPRAIDPKASRRLTRERRGLCSRHCRTGQSEAISLKRALL